MADHVIQQFLAALHAGRACLHPTDTLPGLTFDPTSAAGRAAVLAIKGRPDSKPFLGLVPSLAMARRFYAPLPGDWEKILGAAWPGPLSVVWKASPLAPPAMVADDGTIGLRVPQLPVAAAWFRAVLENLTVPLPSTSVNRTGDAPLRTYTEAAALVGAAPGGFAPPWRDPGESVETPASTIVQLHDDGSFTVLREGALPSSTLVAQ